MRRAGRSILAVVVGAVVAMILVSVVEMVSGLLYPLPADVDPPQPDLMQQYIARLPIGAFLLVLAGWAVGSFVGGWVAARLAGRAPLTHGLVIGLLFLAAGIMTMLMIPHPLYMWVGGIVLPLACSYLGARLVRGGPGQRVLTAA